MYSKPSRKLALAAAALIFGVIAMPASAQQATFHLPFEAHWGRTVIEPGDYKLFGLSGASGSHIIEVVSPSHGSMVASVLTEIQKPGDHSYIEFVKVNGAYFVKRYKSALTGHVFHFVVPKIKPEETRAAVSTTTIPVEGGTK